jgi:hypothetical protein
MKNMRNIVVFFLLFPFVITQQVIAADIESRATDTYASLAASAFQQDNVVVAVDLLLEKNVPLGQIVGSAANRRVPMDSLVAALLDAGLAQDEIILQTMLGPVYFKNALTALGANGISAKTVLKLLVRKRAEKRRIVETCSFMLDQEGYSKADILRALVEAEADRDTIVAVVRELDIPPATVAGVFQAAARAPRGFGHVFTRQALPQPALTAMGISRITPGDAFKKRDIISPSSP